MFLGLRTVVYHVEDLEGAKAWYADVLGTAPYFDEPYYVGFDVAGYELGLVSAEGARPPGFGGVDVYWGVEDIDEAFDRLSRQGAEPLGEVQEVGEGIKVAVLRDPVGNPLGIIENPHFRPGGEGGVEAEDEEDG